MAETMVSLPLLPSVLGVHLVSRGSYDMMSLPQFAHHNDRAAAAVNINLTKNSLPLYLLLGSVPECSGVGL